MKSANRKKEHLKRLKLMEVDIGNLKIDDMNSMVWCGLCHHVYSLVSWLESDFVCPSKGCGSKKGVLWENYHALNEKYQPKPEEGKHYAP